MSVSVSDETNCCARRYADFPVFDTSRGRFVEAAVKTSKGMGLLSCPKASQRRIPLANRDTLIGMEQGNGRDLERVLFHCSFYARKASSSLTINHSRPGQISERADLSQCLASSLNSEYNDALAYSMVNNARHVT